jgi:DNA invertase Pin-like site-specific DNA recombinase
MLHIMGSVAEFERAIMLERQREGIAKAKAEGNSKAALQLLNEKPVKLSNLRNEVQRLRRLEKGLESVELQFSEC